VDLADRFLLLALASDSDGWPLGRDGRPEVPTVYRLGAAAALLAELAVRGRIIPDRRVALRNPALTGNAELDSALHVVPPDGRRVEQCVAAIATGRPDFERLHRMRTFGLLHIYPRHGRNWLFVRETTTTFDEIVAPLHAAMRDGRCDEQTRALLALLRASGLHRAWLKGLPPAEREGRLRALLPNDWLRHALGTNLPAVT
jgi:hypothetical protein